MHSIEVASNSEAKLGGYEQYEFYIPISYKIHDHIHISVTLSEEIPNKRASISRELGKRLVRLMLGLPTFGRKYDSAFPFPIPKAGAARVISIKDGLETAQRRPRDLTIANNDGRSVSAMDSNMNSIFSLDQATIVLAFHNDSRLGCRFTVVVAIVSFLPARLQLTHHREIITPLKIGCAWGAREQQRNIWLFFMQKDAYLPTYSLQVYRKYAYPYSFSGTQL